MPPWHADPKHGKFANDRSLSAADRETLLRWANDGAPKGDAKDMPRAAEVHRWLVHRQARPRGLDARLQGAG